jgi:hypothetical protein
MEPGDFPMFSQKVLNVRLVPVPADYPGVKMLGGLNGSAPSYRKVRAFIRVASGGEQEDPGC